VAFRDEQLFLIFEAANAILQELLQNNISMDNGGHYARSSFTVKCIILTFLIQPSVIGYVTQS
jgi:hypothetical protein